MLLFSRTCVCLCQQHLRCRVLVHANVVAAHGVRRRTRGVCASEGVDDDGRLLHIARAGKQGQGNGENVRSNLLPTELIALLITREHHFISHGVLAPAPANGHEVHLLFVRRLLLLLDIRRLLVVGRHFAVGRAAPKPRCAQRRACVHSLAGRHLRGKFVMWWSVAVRVCANACVSVCQCVRVH